MFLYPNLLYKCKKEVDWNKSKHNRFRLKCHKEVEQFSDTKKRSLKENETFKSY